MNDIVTLMIKMYETYEYDWMNYKIDNEDVTFHHILKEELGGKYTIDNGALLTKRAHEYLHLIERFDVDIYEKINNVLKDINTQEHAPNYKQKKKIDLLLLEFEIKYASEFIKLKKMSNKKKTTIATNNRLQSQKQRKKY